MSSLDKEKTLEAFTAAYKKANGKAPAVEAANGWYSVDGGKNMRLAQLDEWRQELEGSKTEKKASGTKKPATKTAATKKPAAKKAATKKAAPKKTKSSKKAAAKGAGTPAQLWRDQLAAEPGNSRLPRGMK
ncbi:hypothetical protein ACR0ST_04955 [Aliidiomarina sp. Khilg15.8]